MLKPLLWQERIKPAIESTIPRGQAVSSDVFINDRILFGTRARGNAGFTLWQLGAMAKMPLNSDTLNQVYTAMTQFKTDSGRPMNVRPTLLVVPTALRNEARKLLDRRIWTVAQATRITSCLIIWLRRGLTDFIVLFMGRVCGG